MTAFLALLATRKKAIAGALAPLVVAAVAHWGFDIDIPTATLAITSIITLLAVHETSNKETT